MRTPPLTRLLGVLAVFASVTAVADPAPFVVLVGGYQALGVEPRRVSELEEALRAGLASRPVTLVAPDATDKVRKGLGLCGEDAACIGAIGERVGARWVVGYGVGKVGVSVLVNLLFVDVRSGKTSATVSRKTAPAAIGSTAAPLLDELLKGIELAPPVEPPPAPPTPPPAVLVPVEAPPPAVEVPNLTLVEERKRPMRAAAIGTGVVTGAFGIAAIAVGALAQKNYNTLKLTQVDQRDDLSRTQTRLNLGADVTMGVAIAAAVATVVFVVLDQAGK